jgi:hypothetical protein
MAWLSKIFFGKKRSLVDIETIVRNYGSALVNAAGSVRDVRELPYSKEIIEEALISAMKFTEDVVMREQLAVGFVSLADFQELSREERKELVAWENGIIKGIEQSSDLEASAHFVEGSGGSVLHLLQKVAEETALRSQRIESLFPRGQT